MSSIDRNWTLGTLNTAREIQDLMYQAGLAKDDTITIEISGDRAYSMALLIAAVRDGLLEDLHSKRVQAEIDGMVWP